MIAGNSKGRDLQSLYWRLITIDRIQGIIRTMMLEPSNFNNRLLGCRCGWWVLGCDELPRRGQQGSSS